MSKEYHDENLHVLIECKTGNNSLDKSVEMTILGYVYLAVYCLQNDKFGELIDKSKMISMEFKKLVDIENRHEQ